MSLDFGQPPVPQTASRTLNDYVADRLQEFLAHPDIAEQLAPAAATFVELSRVFVGMFLIARTFGERAAESHPSKAYAPFLIERGVDPAWARGMASLAIKRGVSNCG